MLAALAGGPVAAPLAGPGCRAGGGAGGTSAGGTAPPLHHPSISRARRKEQSPSSSNKRPRPATATATPSRPCCAARALWGSSSSSNNNNGSDDNADNNASSSSPRENDGGAGPFGRHARNSSRGRHAHNTGRASADADRRRRALLDYALGSQPSEMDAFARSSPPAVVAAMRATVANMLGTLPPAYFEVRVLTEPQTLAHLFFSAAMTGWMFRNCVLRLELRSALAGAALDAGSASPPAAVAPLPPPKTQAPTPAETPADTAAKPASTASMTWSPSVAEQYAPGAQKDRVQGEVLLWHLERESVERLPAASYISGLEDEVARLRSALADAQGAGRAGEAARAAAALLETAGDGGGIGGGGGSGAVLAPAAAVGGGAPPAALQVVPRSSAGGNPLLEYLRALDAAALRDLTAGIGDGAAAAVDAFVARLLGVASARDGDALRRCDASECSAAELGRALFWLMVVGYTLRSLEMQLDLDGVVGGGGGGGGGMGGMGGAISAFGKQQKEKWRWPI